MKVILLQDVSKVGRRGEVKEVNAGYGTNFLIKKGLAKLATADATAKLHKEQKDISEKKAKLLERLQEHKVELEKRAFAVRVRAGDKGQVFGSVSEKDIISSIYQKTKIQLEKSQLPNLHGIKTLGEHIITIKLGGGVTAQTKLNLES